MNSMVKSMVWSLNKIMVKNKLVWGATLHMWRYLPIYTIISMSHSPVCIMVQISQSNYLLQTTEIKVTITQCFDSRWQLCIGEGCAEWLQKAFWATLQSNSTWMSMWSYPCGENGDGENLGTPHRYLCAIHSKLTLFIATIDEKTPGWIVVK